MISNINVRVEQELKDQANAVFNSMGLNMSVAVIAFLKRVVADGKIPFELRVNDPLYNQHNLEHLRRQIMETQQGKLEVHELSSDMSDDSPMAVRCSENLEK